MASSLKEEQMASTNITEDGGSQVSLQSSSIEEEPEYPTGLRLLSVLVPLGICTFLIALDNTIIGTAIPKITDEFHALDDVGWYGSAYLFTLCAFQPIIGKIFTLLPIKYVYLGSLLTFEIGSAICGWAPNSITLILGRAIAGIGAAGDFSGGLTIIAHTVPLAKRPLVTGLLGASWGIACVAGPLLGGALTTHASWRWCFWINLPAGAVVLTVLFFAFQPPKSTAQLQKRNPLGEAPTWKQSLRRLDPLGTITFIAGVTCCLLAIQWGGSKYAWSNPRIVVLFILSVTLILAFGFIESRMGSDALIPVQIINRRSVLASAFFVTCLGGVMYTYVYFYPIWFQAIRGVTPWRSAVMLIPFLLGVILMSIIAGIAVTLIGYYTPPMLLSSLLTSIGAGLSTTLLPTSGPPAWIGYQVLLGAGVGLGLQQPLICIQTELPTADVPIGTGVIMFMQTFGGAIFLAVADNVFLSRLAAGLASIDPNAGGGGAAALAGAGVTDLAHFSPAVKAVYNKALTQTWYVPVALACLSLCGAVLVRWRSVKTPKLAAAATAAGGEVDAEKAAVTAADQRSTTSTTSIESDEASLEERRSREREVAGAVKRMHRHLRRVTPDVGACLPARFRRRA